ncbi:MAG: helix-turn-helix domain-containing protein [Candidatus Competibacteraceae bacterium]
MQRLVAAKTIPFIKVRNKVRFPMAALDQWIVDQTRYPETGSRGEQPEDVCSERKAVPTGGSNTATPAGERLSNLLRLPTAPRPRSSNPKNAPQSGIKPNAA